MFSIFDIFLLISGNDIETADAHNGNEAPRFL